MISLPIIAVFRAVPWWLWAGAAMLAWGGWNRHQARVQTDLRAKAEAAAQVHAVAAEAERKARAEEAETNDRARRAADAYASTITRVRRDADSARAELDRMRDAIAAAPAVCQATPGAAAADGTDGTAGMRRVLAECVGAIQTLAQAADSDAAKLTGLQAYIKAISPSASAP